MSKGVDFESLRLTGQPGALAMAAILDPAAIRAIQRWERLWDRLERRALARSHQQRRRRRRHGMRRGVWM